MGARRQLVAAALAAALLPVAAAPASAAPPTNDEPQGAVVVHLGGKVVQDTSEATTTPADADLNAACGAPATNASVWFSFTPAEDRKVVLDVSSSDYSAGLLVFAGTPTTGSLVVCGEDLVPLRARAGRTYTIMAVSDTDVNGGRLVLSLRKAPPPPRVSVTVAARGVAYRGGGGAARLHGTYTCRNGLFSAVSVRLGQRAGRLKVRASGGSEIRCDGKRRTWSATLESPLATFARGRARARVAIFACGIFACRQDRADRDVWLAWAAEPEPDRGDDARAAATAARPRPLVGRHRY